MKIMSDSKRATKVNRLKSLDELKALRESIIKSRDPDKPCVVICGGTGCLALGATSIISTFQREIEGHELDTKVDLKVTGCHGFCEKGPHVLIRPQGILYPRVKDKDVAEIISETAIKGNIIDRLLYIDPNTNQKIAYEQKIPFYERQKRIIFGSNDIIDF